MQTAPLTFVAGDDGQGGGTVTFGGATSGWQHFSVTFVLLFPLHVLVLIGSMYSVNLPGSIHVHTLSAERLCVAGSCHKECSQC